MGVQAFVRPNGLSKYPGEDGHGERIVGGGAGHGTADDDGGDGGGAAARQAPKHHLG